MNEGGIFRGSSGGERDAVSGSLFEQPEASSLSRVRVRPNSCRDYLRKQTAAAWSEIVKAVVDKATSGSVPHVTLLAKLAGFERGPAKSAEPKRRGKSLAQQLREQMDELEARNIAEFGE